MDVQIVDVVGFAAFRCIYDCSLAQVLWKLSRNLQSTLLNFLKQEEIKLEEIR